MLGFEITEQPPSRVVVDEIFSCAFHCPETSRTFSEIMKTFTPNNSFATAKLVDLPTLEDIDDETYTLGSLRAQFSDNAADRILRFQIGIRKPGSYKLLLAIHAKTSDWNTSVHYPVISDLWTDEIYVREPAPQPATEDLPQLYRTGLPPIRTSESLVAEDGYEDLRATPIAILESGLPSEYYRIIMEAPLTAYQRTYLIQAMTAVTADKNGDCPGEETEDSSSDDDDEGGVPLSENDLEDRGLIEPFGAFSPIEWQGFI